MPIRKSLLSSLGFHVFLGHVSFHLRKLHLTLPVFSPLHFCLIYFSSALHPFGTSIASISELRKSQSLRECFPKPCPCNWHALLGGGRGLCLHVSCAHFCHFAKCCVFSICVTYCVRHNCSAKERKVRFFSCNSGFGFVFWLTAWSLLNLSHSSQVFIQSWIKLLRFTLISDGKIGGCTSILYLEPLFLGLT